MSNELNNIIARNSDGVYEGVAIGGDRYPGTRFIDHLLRYQDNPTVSVREVVHDSKGCSEHSMITKVMRTLQVGVHCGCRTLLTELRTNLLHPVIDRLDLFQE